MKWAWGLWKFCGLCSLVIAGERRQTPLKSRPENKKRFLKGPLMLVSGFSSRYHNPGIEPSSRS